MQWYCGYITVTGSPVFEAFASEVVPTRESHGSMYGAVLGPFKTKRAAKWAERFALCNPHCCHVDDIERLARLDTMPESD